VPVRKQGGSSKLHACKKTKIEEVKDNIRVSENLGNRDDYNSPMQEVILSNCLPLQITTEDLKMEKTPSQLERKQEVISTERLVSRSSPSLPEQQRGRGLMGVLERTFVTALDSRVQNRFHSVKESFESPIMRNVSPEPELWRDYSTPGATFTTFELERMALYTWRHRLRMNHEYLPDRNLSENICLDHVRILIAALTN
jgi:hypothetical protein